jgi:hypothetical protein
MARGIKDKVVILDMGCSKFGERQPTRRGITSASDPKRTFAL